MNGPEYLTSRTAQVFIPLIKFLQCSLVSSSFLVFPRYSFLNAFIHLYLFDGVRFQYFQVLISFFSLNVLIFSWFSSSIPSVFCRFPLIIIAHFSMPNFFPMSWQYILIACIRVSNSFSFLTNSLMPSMYRRGLIFSCDSLCFIHQSIS